MRGRRPASLQPNPARSLKVILRPGPYSCADWDFGGFPYWLLKVPDIKLRTQDPRYLEACRKYLLAVGRELGPLQTTKGGPIIMVQVENEYGSYGSDKEYIGRLRDFLKEAGFAVPLFTCDGPSQLKNDTRDDLFCVVNFGGGPEANFKALRAIRPSGPLMCGEYYPGWFDSWGKPHHLGNTQTIVNELAWMLEHNASFSIYMVHGGTSFGFTAGANCPPFSPQVTSYDYDAPISEPGWDTPKFHALRDLFLSPSARASSRPPSFRARGSRPSRVSPPATSIRLQRAWQELDVPQCGYCQAGQIMSAAALLAGKPRPTDADIDAAMSDNLCRCATYLRIRAGIHRAAALASGASPAGPRRGTGRSDPRKWSG